MENYKIKMEWLDNNTIKLDKELNSIDTFVLDFVKILKEHTPYVIISGYVSILLGRSRSTEDIDFFLPELSKEIWIRLHSELIKKGYWCMNTDDIEEAFSYLNEGLAVRFARKDEIAPNAELKFAKTQLSKEALHDNITVITKEGKIIISSLERQIAFKRYYLKSYKDIEDATHIEEVMKGKINKNKVLYYKQRIENETP